MLHQPVAAAESNEFAIAAGEPLRPQTFEVADNRVDQPAPKPQPRWTGSISAAVTSTHGRTDVKYLPGIGLTF